MMTLSTANGKFHGGGLVLWSIPLFLPVSLLLSCGGGNLDGTMDRSKLIKSQTSDTRCTTTGIIAAGDYHTVALKRDGTVVGAGYNGMGQLDVTTWTGIQATAAGMSHTVGLKKDGTVVGTGDTVLGQLDVTEWTDITAVAAGRYHTVGRKADGTVLSAGYNGQGQLAVGAWADIIAITAGTYHTVGLKADGTVVAVGHDGMGQLGVSAWTDIVALAAGTYHTAGLKADGTAVAVGYNGTDQLEVGDWTDVIAIAAGAYHTVGLKTDGTVVAAGYNGQGQVEVGDWTDIIAIAAGAYHTVGLKADGTVVAVGYNGQGQREVSSFADIIPDCSLELDVFLDVSAPRTTAVLSGTQGNNGWYRSDVVVALTAEDGEGGSGVKEIHSILDGREFVVEGNAASLPVSGDGTHVLSWYSVDNAGNKEEPQELAINIDATPPSFTVSADPPILWPPNHAIWDVQVDGSAADEGSGAASAVLTISDEYGIHNMICPGLGSTIQLEAWREGADLDGRMYTITATVTDNAGNTSAGTVTVLVPHDQR